MKCAFFTALGEIQFIYTGPSIDIQAAANPGLDYLLVDESVATDTHWIPDTGAPVATALPARPSDYHVFDYGIGAWVYATDAKTRAYDVLYRRYLVIIEAMKYEPITSVHYYYSGLTANYFATEQYRERYVNPYTMAVGGGGTAFQMLDADGNIFITAVGWFTGSYNNPLYNIYLRDGLLDNMLFSAIENLQAIRDDSLQTVDDMLAYDPGFVLPTYPYSGSLSDINLPITEAHYAGDAHMRYAQLIGRTGESLKYTGNQFVHGSGNTINSGATIYSISGRSNVVSSNANIVGGLNTVGSGSNNAAILGNLNNIGNSSAGIAIVGTSCSVAASSTYAVIVGNNCTVTAEGGVAVGTYCNAGAYSAALGIYVTASGYDTLALSSYTLDVSANMSIVLATDATGINFTTDNVFAVYGPTKFGFNVPNPTKDLDWNGQAARTWWLARKTTANQAGSSLTVQAGGATTGATDKSGGTLVLAGGIATGSGNSRVQIQTAQTGAAGTADRSPTTIIDALNNQLGFFGATPATKPTVTGSRTDGTALTSLLTALAALGLITDSTTA